MNMMISMNLSNCFPLKIFSKQHSQGAAASSWDRPSAHHPPASSSAAAPALPPPPADGAWNHQEMARQYQTHIQQQLIRPPDPFEGHAAYEQQHIVGFPHVMKIAPFGNIALRRFSFPHDGASELCAMLTSHDGKQTDQYIFVRLQNVNPVSVLGVDYLEVANHFGVAMHKGFFCVCRTRLMRNFCAFCEVLCVRSRGPRACKAMVMSEAKLMSKLGRSTVEDLKSRADQLDISAARDLGNCKTSSIYLILIFLISYLIFRIKHNIHICSSVSM
jgi:hypothetical protein